MRDALRFTRSGLVRLALFAGLLLVCTPGSYAQETLRTTPNPRVETALLPERAFERVEFLNVRDADLRDVLRSIASSYGVNLVVDNSVEEQVTLALEDVTVLDAVLFIARTYNLRIEQTGSILRLYRETPPPLPLPDPVLEITITGRDTLLTADLQNLDVREAARLITQKTGTNVVVPAGLSGQVTTYLSGVPLSEGIRTLFGANGFIATRQGAVVTLSRPPSPEGGAPMQTFGSAGITVTEDSLVALDVQSAPVYGLTEEIARAFGFDLVLYQVPTHSVTLRTRGLQVRDALDYLYRGSALTYRLDESADGTTLVVGAREGETMNGSRLLRLEHLRAEAAFELLPADIKNRATVQLVREHNALLAEGDAETIQNVVRYLKEIDRPTPLILIEALVVDYDESAIREIGLTFGRGAVDSSYAAGRYEYDAGFAGGEARVDLGRRDAQRALQFGSDLFGLGTVGRLPADFYARIRALETQGNAKVLSRPQISTLSGHAATISVGTTQYYILRTSTPVTGGTGGFIPFESERFEKVEANVQVEVTPWVSTSGEVIATIRPEFSTPVGRLTSSVPPTINTRVLEANVRLKDGETIILGGLIQETEAVERSGVPFLSRIPLLGRLFRGSRTTKRKSELVIYLTPHVFYGDERDAEKWQDTRTRLKLSDPETQQKIGYTTVEK